MANELTIVKLGGSVITEKKKARTPLPRAINAALSAISTSKQERIIIIHGGGSFGHPIARKYHIQNGFSDSSQIPGVVKTRQSMMELNKIVVDSGINHGLPCVSLAPSSFIRCVNKRIVDMNTEIISSLLDLNIIPVLFGDVVVDTATRFCILSGDQIAAKIAVSCEASRVVLAVDVDGVYDSDPKTNPNAKLVRVLSLADGMDFSFNRVAPEGRYDVTGGMIAKVKEMAPAVEYGATVAIVNGRKPAVLCNALKGRKTTGTMVQR